jgi:hypothetical protein
MHPPRRRGGIYWLSIFTGGAFVKRNFAENEYFTTERFIRSAFLAMKVPGKDCFDGQIIRSCVSPI